MSALTTATILNDPRWSDEGAVGEPSPAVRLYDELSERYGSDETARVWSQACREYDLLSESA